MIFKVATFCCGSGGKTLGLLRARYRGARFVSVGAFDKDPLACADFELLTGADASCIDLSEVTAEQLRELCERPDVVVMSPPCKGLSGCLSEALASTERYQALNRLALRCVELALDTWDVPPAFILLENVPRMATRGARLLERMTERLRAAGYEVDVRPHDCGELGNLAQSRKRLLLVARHRGLAPSELLMPPSLGLRSMASELWRLPVPVPGSTEGGKHHRLPRLAPINWLRLAAIPAGCDWGEIPAAIHVGGDLDVRLPIDGRRHAGKYGPQDAQQPSHAVLAESRTGKGWADVADPRLAGRAARHNGGFGVNVSTAPAHTVVAEGTVRNGWNSVNDPRLGCRPRVGTMGVADPASTSTTIIGAGDIHNSTTAVADPRSGCRRREGSIGVCEPAKPYPTAVIGHQKTENSPTAVADPRLEHAPRRGCFGVQNPAQTSATIRGQHSIRQAPSAVADRRRLFEPTHELVAGQRWTGDREAWVSGEFWLLGPELDLRRGGRPKYVIIRAPDGTVHRPLTTLELAALQGFPVWHRPGDPTELELYDERGQWLELHGNDAEVREHVGNAVPPATAQAIGEQMLEVLVAGAKGRFRLCNEGIWVSPHISGIARHGGYVRAEVTAP